MPSRPDASSSRVPGSGTDTVGGTGTGFSGVAATPMRKMSHSPASQLPAVGLIRSQLPPAYPAQLASWPMVGKYPQGALPLTPPAVKFCQPADGLVPAFASAICSESLPTSPCENGAP